MEIIGENNPEHFFVATQDFDLRKKFREVSIFDLMLVPYFLLFPPNLHPFSLVYELFFHYCIESACYYEVFF